MRLRPLCVVVLMLLLVPTTALANDHVARIAGGHSKVKGSSFDGGHGSVEVALKFTKDKLAIVVDSSVYGGSDAGLPVTKAAILFGLRGVYRPGDKRVVLFAHVLPFGYYRSHIGDAATDGSPIGAGGGIDYLLGAAGNPPTKEGEPPPPNPQKSGWILSLQADWVKIAGENSLRINSGVGFRYK